jgi:hypothetical protein
VEGVTAQDAGNQVCNVDTNSENSRPSHQFLNRDLRVVVGREDDERLGDARQPRTPAANKSLIFTPDFHSLNMGCSFPGMIVVPFSVF